MRIVRAITLPQDGAMPPSSPHSLAGLRWGEANLASGMGAPPFRTSALG